MIARLVRRWSSLSLRTRLVTLYVGLLALLLLALGAVLYNDTREFMFTTSERRLRSDASLVLDRALPGVRFFTAIPLREPNPPRGTFNNILSFQEVADLMARVLTIRETTAVIYDADGAMIANGRTLPEQSLAAPLDQPLFKRALDTETAVSYTARAGTQNTLVVLIPFRRTLGESVYRGVAQLNMSLEFIDQVLWREQLFIGLGIVVTLVLATLGGVWLTNSALAPLLTMITTSRRIASGDLTQRVNLPQRRDEIGQLAASFDHMVDQLEHTVETQRHFIADASHELRTPLTAIGGLLDVLLLAPEGDPATTHRMLHGMRREVDRVTRLVSDLITLTRLDAQPALRNQNVDMGELAREAVQDIKPLAGERAVTVEVSGDTHLRGDTDRLKQVLLNLLDNAVRYTDAVNGTINVHVEGNVSDVRTSVSDNGAGIPSEALPQVFERFYRVDKARGRASGGSGLGLAIVQAIVQAHGGKVESVVSVPGQGARFSLVLPRGRSTVQEGLDGS